MMSLMPLYFACLFIDIDAMPRHAAAAPPPMPPPRLSLMLAA